MFNTTNLDIVSRNLVANRPRQYRMALLSSLLKCGWIILSFAIHGATDTPHLLVELCSNETSADILSPALPREVENIFRFGHLCLMVPCSSLLPPFVRRSSSSDTVQMQACLVQTISRHGETRTSFQ